MPNSVLDVGLRVGKMETDKFKGKYSHRQIQSQQHVQEVGSG